MCIGVKYANVNYVVTWGRLWVLRIITVMCYVESQVFPSVAAAVVTLVLSPAVTVVANSCASSLRSCQTPQRKGGSGPGQDMQETSWGAQVRKGLSLLSHTPMQLHTGFMLPTWGIHCPSINTNPVEAYLRSPHIGSCRTEVADDQDRWAGRSCYVHVYLNIVIWDLFCLVTTSPLTVTEK